MIELVLIACLLREPARCEAHQLPTGHESLVACMVAGQHLLVRWQAEHPSWRVRRWRCDFPLA